MIYAKEPNHEEQQSTTNQNKKKIIHKKSFTRFTSFTNTEAHIPKVWALTII